MTIARLVNHRNPHIAMLALALLETLVQSCGYPFHLQIATKEFLNELVRRFPERPPPFPGPVMQKILDLIHGWKEGICVDSRWKDDFQNIREMHRLLTYKGYRFREVPRQAAVPSASVSILCPLWGTKDAPVRNITFGVARTSNRRRSSRRRTAKRSLRSFKSSFEEAHHATSQPRKNS